VQMKLEEINHSIIIIHRFKKMPKRKWMGDWVV